MGSRFTDSDRAEAILHAAVFGDDAAVAKYGCAERTLRSWREEARDPDSQIAAVCRRFQAAIRETQGDEVGAVDVRAESLAVFIDGAVRRLSAIIEKKAEDINAANPQSIEAVNNHVATLLGHAAALQYLAGLFGAPADGAGAGPYEGST